MPYLPYLPEEDRPNPLRCSISHRREHILQYSSCWSMLQLLAGGCQMTSWPVNIKTVHRRGRPVARRRRHPIGRRAVTFQSYRCFPSSVGQVIERVITLRNDRSSTDQSADPSSIIVVICRYLTRLGDRAWYDIPEVVVVRRKCRSEHACSKCGAFCCQVYTAAALTVVGSPFVSEPVDPSKV